MPCLRARGWTDREVVFCTFGRGHGGWKDVNVGDVNHRHLRCLASRRSGPIGRRYHQWHQGRGGANELAGVSFHGQIFPMLPRGVGQLWGHGAVFS